MKYCLRSLVPKRSWFQFSLGTLLTTVTVVCILLGRIDYLRSKAAFHSDEAGRHLTRIQRERSLSESDARGYVDFAKGGKGHNTAWFGPPEYRFQLVLTDDADTRAVRHHYRLSQEFAFATSHPWLVVNEAESP